MSRKQFCSLNPHKPNTNILTGGQFKSSVWFSSVFASLQHFHSDPSSYGQELVLIMGREIFKSVMGAFAFHNPLKMNKRL